MSQLPDASIVYASRQAPGRKGRPINLTSNTFALRTFITPNTTWFKYQVEFLAPAKPPNGPRDITKDQREIWRELDLSESQDLTNHFGKVAVVFDGRSACFASGPLPAESLKIQFTLKSRRRIEIHIFNPTQLSPIEIVTASLGNNFYSSSRADSLAALNVLITHSISLLGIPTTKTVSYINNPSDFSLSSQHAPFKLGDYIDLWRGFYASIRPALAPPGRDSALYVNFDTTTGAFFCSGSVMSVLEPMVERRWDVRSMNSQTRIRINRIFKGIKIEADFGGSIKVRKPWLLLGNESARSLEFQGSDGKMTNVHNFFKEVHNINLRYPDAPIVIVKKGTKDSTPTAWPIELCSFARGNRYIKHLTSDLQEKAVQFQTLDPGVRIEAIRRIAQTALASSKQLLSKFSLEVIGRDNTAEPEAIQGRLLSPPTILFSSHLSSAPPERSYVSAGAWRMTPRQTRFLNSTTISSFAIILDSERDEQNACRFFGALHENFGDLGVNVGADVDGGRGRRLNLGRLCVTSKGRNMNEIWEEAKTRANTVFGKEMELVYYVFGRKSAESNYATFKSMGVARGVATQSILAKNLNKTSNLQFHINMGLKINPKLSGLNFILEKKLPVALYFGADLTHSKDRPSIAAVCASSDRDGLYYESDIRVQPLREIQRPDGSYKASRNEIIQNLEAMILNHLRKFAKATNSVPPPNLVFFRDGASEGEFDAIARQEIPAIESAIRRFMAEPEFRSLKRFDSFVFPKITFIVVVKRHHIRFFANSKNIEPGTVVDTHVADPQVFDWYAAHHKGILGTSKPSRYVVLRDDQSNSSDELQEMVSNLCHGYQRCNRSVSCPAPVMYADLICTRVREWFNASLPSFSGSVRSGGSDSTTPESRAIDYKRHQQMLESILDGVQGFKRGGKNNNMPSMWFM